MIRRGFFGSPIRHLLNFTGINNEPSRSHLLTFSYRPPSTASVVVEPPRPSYDREKMFKVIEIDNRLKDAFQRFYHSRPKNHEKLMENLGAVSLRIGFALVSYMELLTGSSHYIHRTHNYNIQYDMRMSSGWIPSSSSYAGQKIEILSTEKDDKLSVHSPKIILYLVSRNSFSGHKPNLEVMGFDQSNPTYRVHNIGVEYNVHPIQPHIEQIFDHAVKSAQSLQQKWGEEWYNAL